MATRTIVKEETAVTTIKITDSADSGGERSTQPPAAPNQEPRYTEPASPPPSPATGATAFAAGIQAERQRALFGERLRTAVARRLENTAQGSHDPVAVALLEQQEPKIAFEAVGPHPSKTELTTEQQAFAAAITAKINRTLRPEARAR